MKECLHKVVFTDLIKVLQHTSVGIKSKKIFKKTVKNCLGYRKLGVTKAKRTKSITIPPWPPPTNHLLCHPTGTGSYCLQCSEESGVEIGASIAASSQHDHSLAAVYWRRVNTVISIALSTVLPFPENIAPRCGSLLVRKCRQLRNWHGVKNAYSILTTRSPLTA